MTNGQPYSSQPGQASDIESGRGTERRQIIKQTVTDLDLAKFSQSTSLEMILEPNLPAVLGAAAVVVEGVVVVVIK